MYLAQITTLRESRLNSAGMVGGAMVLGNFQCRGVLLNLDNSRARAYCACISVGWELSRHLGVVGWCDGAGLTFSAEASYNFDYSRARAYCACSRCGRGWFGHFYSHLSFYFFLPIFGWLVD